MPRLGMRWKVTALTSWMQGIAEALRHLSIRPSGRLDLKVVSA